MMANSTEAPIDLTLSSDDEPGVSSTAVAPPSLRSLKTPRHLGGVSHFPQQAAAGPARPTTTIPSPQYAKAQPSPLVYNAITGSPLSSAGLPRTSGRPPNNGYVPVFNTAFPTEESHDSGIPQAQKRRKITPTISTPRMHESWEPARSEKQHQEKFYGVRFGRVPGVYSDWQTVLQQLKGYKGAMQQRFKTREEAQAFVDNPAKNWRDPPPWSVNNLARTTPSTFPYPLTAEAGGGGYNYELASRPSAASSPSVELKTNGLPSVEPLSSFLNPKAAGDLSTENKENPRFQHQTKPSGSATAQSASDASHDAPYKQAIGSSSNGNVSADQHHNRLSKPLTHNRPHANSPRSPGGHLSNPSDRNSKNMSATDTVLDTFVKDDNVYLELLSRASDNDKIALLLSNTPRAQAMLKNVAASTKMGANQKPPAQASASNVPPHSASLASSGRDSVFSDSGTSGASVNITKTKSNVAYPPQKSTISEQSMTRPKWTGGLTLEEAHLLIYLKEVRKYRWTEITAKFQQHFPARSYAILQTNYSQKINRRDRSQDPPTLLLPPCYASDAQTHNVDVHPSPGHPADRSRQRKRGTDEKRERFQQGSKPVLAPTRTTTIDLLQDQSSGTESSSRNRRPRRTVPIKDYTWPTKNTRLVEDSFGDVDIDMEELNEESSARSESPAELDPAPEKAIAVENEPLSVEFYQHDASLAIMTSGGKTNTDLQSVPYLSYCQRSGLSSAPRGFEWDQLVSRDWRGALLHVDFSSVEMDIAEAVIRRSLKHQKVTRSRNQAKRLHRLLERATEPELLLIANALRSKLNSRDCASIGSLLQDAKENRTRGTAPRVERLGAARPDKSFSSEARSSLASMIRRREIGVQSYRGWSSATKSLSYQMKNRVQDSLGPVCSYTGASSDVHAVAWSVDGQCFAAGAICVDDPHSMQYNRSNNLLYGDVSRNTINELGKHHVPRPKTDSGPNSTHAMYASQDTKLYKTVTAVAFSPNGRYMFSGGYDQNVTVWQTSYDGSQPADIVSLRFQAEVLMMDVNNSGVLATATKKSTGKAVKVLQINEDDPLQPPASAKFKSEKATQRPEMNIQPTALHFSPRHGNLLLGGFSAQTRQDGRDQMGDICLWDINGNHTINIWGSGKNVFDLSFHPRNSWFAVGTVAGQNKNRGTQSTIRLYDERDTGTHNKYSTLVELECRALDINDVVWCPGDDFLVAAGCTSGRAYVWDVRNPNHFLRELAHGNSIMPLDEHVDREVADTGIRFLTWGENATRLYTGSSDGVVKIWNVARSEEETFVKDLLTLDSGIMSGAFSPDRSRLLLGEVNGTVSVLEVGRDDCSIRDAEKMKYLPYKDFEDHAESSQPVIADASSGRAIAKKLLDSSEMIIAPMGGFSTRQAVQGPAYTGPYDASVEAPFLREQALEMQLKLAAAQESSCEACRTQNLNEDAGNGLKITSESTGDSGRSSDRIPDEMRLQREAGPTDSKISSGTTGEGLCRIPCSRCGLPARPSETANGSDITNLVPRCERCAFSCLRCGYTPPVNEQCLDLKIETYTCPHCNLVWEIGALGYEVVHDSHTPCRIQNHIPELKHFRKEMLLAKMNADSPFGDNNTSFGDEMNALTDHYHSLAIDKTELPL